MKTNQPAVQATAKNNVLQVDPILLSVLAKLSECRSAIFNYAQKNAPCDFHILAEHATNFDDEIYSCISHVGDIVAYQIVEQTCDLYDHE